ncbi:type I-E CRISPR-associated protein Cse2/CasB [Allosalinactinospora lopnorensis]|uniref:type I-E CRISPR-associated protein Cse2/CasB n=1 Tax=Allosalinactinospora lopnorensis TaxID=1352348 RepID=UPI000623D032|nr:type I-E CRISPR-associated protein Cse2/CasB [Allosalinactinospora lopnorensis]
MTSDTATTEASGRTDLTPLGAAVAKRIGSLQGGYLADQPGAVATLAQLRGGAGKLPGDPPDLWGLTGDLTDYISPGCTEKQEEQAETAVHIALTLYALHQQSRREDRMHRGPMWQAGRRRDRDLGWAMRELMAGAEIDESLRKRFVQAGKATSTAILAYRLRGIVQLLRREAVPLDYGLLADQLVTAQQPGGMSKIRSSWGRGFVAYRPPATASDDEPATTDTK